MIEEASVAQERVNYLFVLSYKNPNGNNLSVRIDDQGNISGNNLEEILIAVEFLKDALNR